MQHDSGIFADGVEHAGIVELCDHFAQNEDGLGFELAQIRHFAFAQRHDDILQQ
jgi:hypothetical protein